MIKKGIYPKTKRVKVTEDKVTVTEKLDGSNLVIFKKDNEELYKKYLEKKIKKGQSGYVLITIKED